MIIVYTVCSLYILYSLLIIHYYLIEMCIPPYICWNIWSVVDHTCVCLWIDLDQATIILYASDEYSKVVSQYHVLDCFINIVWYVFVSKWWFLFCVICLTCSYWYILVPHSCYAVIFLIVFTLSFGVTLVLHFKYVKYGIH